MSDEHSLKSSDEDDEFENHVHPNEIQGSLLKWTNYIHGWQERFIVFKDGTLSYYKSPNDTSFGCRGAISIKKATIKAHEFDDCRLDISMNNDSVWYLRADNPEEKNKWFEILESNKYDSAYGSENSLRRHGSAISLGSTSLSTTSISSFKKARGLREKLLEMETFRDILCRQVDTLQNYFDTCVEIASTTDDNSDEMDEELENALLDDHPHLKGDHSPNHKYRSHYSPITRDQAAQHASHSVDFKGEAITFKATTAGILATLSHCIDLMSQREENWKRRLEKEIDRRKKVEDLYKQALSEAKSQSPIVLGGPDYEEGPHCAINEDEFFDAIDAALDKCDLQEEEKLQSKNSISSSIVPTVSTTQNDSITKTPLWAEIDSITMDQFHYSQMEIGEGGWQLFAEDGEMRMYKRELEEGGFVVDPLKAVHTVKGVTGHEMCHYFYSPDVRFDWEVTLENMILVDVVDPSIIITHQIHKRIWPATQRDALFWSHIRRIPNTNDQDAHDIWIVTNQSTEHPKVPVGKCIRIGLTVSLVCQTFVDPPEEGKPITRDNLTCRITYCSTVNPGGWAPPTVLRAVYKREYPKFLKRFTQYVKDRTENLEIMF